MLLYMFIGVLQLLAVELVAAVADDAQGVTTPLACVLVTQPHIPCSTRIPDPALWQETLPPINDCTCNSAFYNLWGACQLGLYGTTFKLSFDDWSASCRDLSVVFTHRDYSPTDTSGILRRAYYPRNVTPNVLAEASTAGPSWTIVQILVPVVVGVVLIVVFILSFVVYRRNKSANGRAISWITPGPRGPRRFFGLLPNIRPVRRDDRPTWAIDDYEEVGNGSTNQARGRAGHVRLPSELIELSTSSSRTTTNSAQSLMPGRTARHAARLWSNPFKRKPVSVVSIPPNPGFRLDDEETPSEPPTSPGRSSNLANGFGGHTQRIFFEDGSGAGDNDAVYENGVLLISREAGVDFSSDAGEPPTNTVHVIPPSSDTHDHRPLSPQVSADSRRTPSPSRSPGLPDVLRAQTPTNGPPASPSLRGLAWPSRSDPAMLFPGPVRAAGYAIPGSPPTDRQNASAESLPSFSSYGAGPGAAF